MNLTGRKMRAVAGAALVGLVVVAGSRTAPGEACPDSRAYLESRLKTTPEDGDLYRIQLESIRMPIDDVIAMMGGTERAYLIAGATREHARELIEAGAEGVELRFWEDTILRADALVEILDCRTGRGSV